MGNSHSENNYTHNGDRSLEQTVDPAQTAPHGLEQTAPGDPDQTDF